MEMRNIYSFFLNLYELLCRTAAFIDLFDVQTSIA